MDFEQQINELIARGNKRELRRLRNTNSVNVTAGLMRALHAGRWKILDWLRSKDCRLYWIADEEQIDLLCQQLRSRKPKLTS